MYFRNFQALLFIMLLIIISGIQHSNLKPYAHWHLSINISNIISRPNISSFLPIFLSWHSPGQMIRNLESRICHPLMSSFVCLVLCIPHIRENIQYLFLLFCLTSLKMAPLNLSTWQIELYGSFLMAPSFLTVCHFVYNILINSSIVTLFIFTISCLLYLLLQLTQVIFLMFVSFMDRYYEV